MSDLQRFGDSESPPYMQGSEEELGESTTDCQVCHFLRLPCPKAIRTTYGELNNSATDGCGLCGLLREISEAVFKGIGLLPPDDGDVLVEPHIVEKEAGAACLTVMLPDEKDKFGGRNKLFLYVLSGCKSPWPFVGPHEMPAESPDIKDCAPFIRDALNTCETEHTDCAAYQSRNSSRVPDSQGFIPKRLLYIGDKTQADRPRLYEASDKASPNGIRFRYAALSHCWGEASIAKTTEDVLSGYIKNGIEWSCLSKTFQEAILLARELGIEYIWIDSLCIVQDSLSDWIDQSSQMSDIFSNAHLTIAASAAENGEKGLLNRAKNSLFPIVHNAEVRTIFTHRFINHELRISDDDRWDLHSIGENRPFPYLSEYTLRKRAWCFQEEIISKRIVHFTQDEMVFICREGTTCECQPHWSPRYLLPPLIGVEYHGSDETWAEILMHYSKQNISFSKDKLPALSGLTPYFEQDSGRYLAGLWESHMPKCLLWRRYRDSQFKRSNSLLSDPPSWSWASVDGEINYDLYIMNQKIIFAELLEAEVYPSTNDPRGMVSGGRVTLRAPLLPLERREHTKKTWCTNSAVYSPGWIPYNTEKGFFEEDLDNPANMTSSPDDCILDPSVSLLVIEALMSENKGRMDVHCLIVGQLEELSKNQNRAMEGSMTEVAYVRMGYARVSSSRTEMHDLLEKHQTTVTLL